MLHSLLGLSHGAGAPEAPPWVIPPRHVKHGVTAPVVTPPPRVMPSVIPPVVTPHLMLHVV